MPEDFQIPLLSNIELKALAEVGAGYAIREGRAGPGLPSNATPDEIRAAEQKERLAQAKEEGLRQEALSTFKSALDERITNAYRAGGLAAVDRADRNSWNARSITLYLVVLAVVTMPAVAMVIKLNPQTFGSYIAPVTGIAGTVVGYWFGTIDRSSGRDKRASENGS